MKDSLLITPGLGASIVSIDVQATQTRDELLALAATVKTVSDRLDADDATNTLRAVNEFTKRIDAQRVAAKAPALDIGRKIDALAKELTEILAMESTRISRAIGTFEAAERAKAEDKRRAAEAEIARIARESQKEATKAYSKGETELAAITAADKVVEKAAVEVAAIRQEIIQTAAPRVAGSQVRGTIAFEVTDAAALYAANPMLCNIEPNGTAIRAILKGSPNLIVPGLRHWIDHKFSI